MANRSHDRSHVSTLNCYGETLKEVGGGIDLSRRLTKAVTELLQEITGFWTQGARCLNRDRGENVV